MSFDQFQDTNERNYMHSPFNIAQAQLQENSYSKEDEQSVTKVFNLVPHLLQIIHKDPKYVGGIVAKLSSRGNALTLTSLLVANHLSTNIPPEELDLARRASRFLLDAACDAVIDKLNPLVDPTRWTVPDLSIQQQINHCLLVKHNLAAKYVPPSVSVK